MRTSHLLSAGVLAVCLATPAQGFQRFRAGGMPSRPAPPAPTLAKPTYVPPPVARPLPPPPPPKTLNSPTMAEVSSAAVVHMDPHLPHPPGWDWWRISPWYLRYPRPYPYYVPYPYPVLMPGMVVSNPYRGAPAATTTPITDLPTVSGPLAVPPPGTAVIRVRVPDFQAQVLFNGKDSDTMGGVRTFVTPNLRGAGTQTYTITASWKRGGQTVSEDREVQVEAGQVRVVDFTRPAG